MANMQEGREQRKSGRITRLRKSKTLYSILLLTLCFAILFGVLVFASSPKQHDIAIGEPAPETIIATKDVEDRIATERERERRANSLTEPIIRTDSQITDQAIEKLEAIFDGIRTIRGEYAVAAMATPTPVITPTPTPTPSQVLDASGVPVESGDPSAVDVFVQATPTPSLAPTPTPVPTPNPKEVYMSIINSDYSYLGLSERDMQALLDADESSFEFMAQAVVTLFSEAMESGVREERLDEVLRNFSLELTTHGISSSLISPARAMASECMVPNAFIDEEATEAERQKLAESVESVIYKKGQNIVSAGELVTEQMYEMIEELGLLSSGGQDFNLYIGIGFLMILLYFVVLIYMLQFERQMLRKPKIILMLVIIMLLQTALAFAFKYINMYLIPLQLAALLIAILIGPRLAITMNMVLGVIVGIVGAGDEGLLASSMFQIMLLATFVGAMAVYLTRFAMRRARLLYSGFILAVLNFVITFSAGVLINTNLMETLTMAAYAAGGGFLSSLLAVALLPLFESMFNLITPQMLLELSTPTQPLLRQLQTEAPGTYHHSILVANLAEAAAERIGANALLCRVGAYYHDIGKTRRPIFFKENQMDQPNPHDGMEPQVSAAILAAHVRDGLAMAEKAKLPQRIRDLITQHHGDDLMAFFYYKAREEAKETGKEVDENDYRYDGPKPQSKEAVILMLADGVEAAARTLKDRSQKNITAFVHKMVRSRLESGQFKEAPVTFRDLDEIEKAFVKTLTGIYHERIEYPSMPMPQRELGSGETEKGEGQST